MKLSITLNDEPVQVEADPAMPALWLLRDVLGLTGTKYGCGIGVCGACTVLVDGEAQRACVLPSAALDGRRVQTIEGVGHTLIASLQRAWLRRQVPQCGYCQSGMIMAAAALLARSESPSADEIREQLTVLCRCGTYQRVVQAIVDVSEELVRGQS
jgi:isoquinoline 1-oxidoreductase alpha subunit